MKTFWPGKALFGLSTWLPYHLLVNFFVFADRLKTRPAVNSEVRRLADRQLLALQQCR